MNANKPSTTWVDTDDSPQVQASDLDRATFHVDGRQVTREQWHADIQARPRGRPRGSKALDTKVQTTIRFDADVLAALKATGPGWQTRVNNTMRAALLGR